MTYTEQELFNQIDSLADGNEPPTYNEFENCPETASASTIERQFDSWNRGIRAAGYSPRCKRWAEEEIIDQIDSLADGNEPPTYDEFDDCPETASVSSVERRFDSWNKAVRAGGYSPRNERASKKDIINQIDSLADGNEPPRSSEFKNCPETASVSLVAKIFGSWNKGLEAAGYDPHIRFRDKQELLAALQQAADARDIGQIKKDDVSSGNFPSKVPYQERFGGVSVAAIRASIDISSPQRLRAIPLTKSELNQFVDSIPEASPRDQAVALIALLTGCAPSEHSWVSENGIEDTETDPVILFPVESKRGARSVSVGPLYNQFVKMFDPISFERISNSIEFSSYPLARSEAAITIRRVSKPIDFDVSRPIIEERPSESGPQVTHRDLRCTHYLFEYCRGASQAMLKRRLRLSDDEIEHYHRYLDDDENGWTVQIEWRD